MELSGVEFMKQRRDVVQARGGGGGGGGGAPDGIGGHHRTAPSRSPCSGPGVAGPEAAARSLPSPVSCGAGGGVAALCSPPLGGWSCTRAVLRGSTHAGLAGWFCPALGGGGGRNGISLQNGSQCARSLPLGRAQCIWTLFIRQQKRRARRRVECKKGGVGGGGVSVEGRGTAGGGEGGALRGALPEATALGTKPNHPGRGLSLLRFARLMLLRGPLRHPKIDLCRLHELGTKGWLLMTPAQRCVYVCLGVRARGSVCVRACV